MAQHDSVYAKEIWPYDLGWLAFHLLSSLRNVCNDVQLSIPFYSSELFSYFHSTDFLLKMQAINEKNGKKCQTLDIYFAARRKEEKLKIHEKMKENENKRLNQGAIKRIIGLF